MQSNSFEIMQSAQQLRKQHRVYEGTSDSDPSNRPVVTLSAELSEEAEISCCYTKF